jgi:hypothetical protein
MLQRCLFSLFAVATFAVAQKPPVSHPDLSGTWAFGIDLPPIGLKHVVQGTAVVNKVDQSARHGNVRVAGAKPSTTL